MGKTTRIRFDAEPQHLLVIDKKTQVSGGKEVTVSEDTAAMLFAAPWVDVSIVDGASPAPVWPGTHDELDKIAAHVALIWPLPPEGKNKLTVTDKVAALEAAGHTPESVLEADVTPDKEGDE